ncbi:HAD family hydrolase [Heyndrickxia sporothermodurans]|uniref:HAD family hydrolase n=1 Tax=Heyndrickxia sporothermodurans TaxID=46224 RepID=UPI002E1A13E6|nr:HAD hydrolase-like protein [Heyndrickxia sporothermodurans]
MEKIKVIVFDLDGTLYEDTHHFDYYANKLCEKLDIEKQELFRKDYEAILAGEHSLKMGAVFDVEHDLILTHVNGHVIQAHTWDGEPLSEHEVGELYPKELQFNFHSMLNIGDLWWVPAAIARHYGIDNESAGKAFLETRQYMMTPEFQMKVVPGFKEVLQQLSGSKKLVLLTNSPKQDSEVLLHKLGFNNLFDTLIFDGKKPIQTKDHLTKIKEKYQVEYHQILCIGDNAINEIFPAKRLGCQTILIDPHAISKSENADYIVSHLSMLVNILKTFER